MGQQQIVVDISPEGEVKIEAKGFTGSTCAAATKPLEDALGVVAGRQLKPEYHQQAQVNTVGVKR
jgi:hypothetical protein